MSALGDWRCAQYKDSTACIDCGKPWTACERAPYNSNWCVRCRDIMARTAKVIEARNARNGGKFVYQPTRRLWPIKRLG